MADRRPVVLILQARMGSTRLPGKSMLPLAGKPLLYRILERVSRVQVVDKVVLAIPSSSSDDPLADVGRACGVEVFRGSEIDVLDRYYKAAQEAGAEIVGRLPADNVAPEPHEIDRIATHHLALPRPGFSSNLAQVFESGYPDGIGAEMVDFSLLQQAWRQSRDSKLREHVHLNFFDYSTQLATDDNWCPVSTIACPKKYARPDVVLDVNTEEQYILMSRMYEDLYPSNPDFGINEIVAWWDDRFSNGR